MPKNKGTQDVFLLDTHIWIWLINGDKKLKNSLFLKRLEQTSGDIKMCVPIISVWEIGMLEAKGRVVLPFDCLQWAKQALNAPGIQLAPLTPEIAIESSRLPGVFHGDPADRMIMTTAKSLLATLVTCDQQMITYAKKHNIQTIF